jgi:hypothetical protein
MEKLMEKLYEKIIRFFTTQRIHSQKVKIDFDFVLTKEQEKRIRQLIRNEVRKHNQIIRKKK